MKKCFIALFALIISLFILLLSTSIVVSNFYFYKQQLKKYDVYKDFNLKSIVDKKTKEIIYYIKDDINSLDSSFFSRRAIRHMKDVKKLYHHLLLFFLWIININPFVFIFLLYKKKDKIIGSCFTNKWIY